jgi:hypothetical protein
MQHLLYIFIICPDVQVVGSGSSSDSGKYVTALDHTWYTKTGAVSVSIRWDRLADAVRIGRQEFKRKAGNVFVVRRRANGEIVGEQLGNLGPSADYPQVLEYVRQQLPKDDLITSLKLQE